MSKGMAADRYLNRWHGYEFMGETMWHPEGAETDMADLCSDELELMFGPIEWPEAS